MRLRARLACIDANLDDLQSGMEACSRAANGLQIDTTKFNGFLNAPLLRSVLQHVKELLSCARDQHVAMQELRDSITSLRDESKVARRASIRPPSDDQARRTLPVRSR